MTLHTNPFFAPYDTPHQTFPFDRCTVADIEEALNEGMQRELEEVQRIAEAEVPPTFKNTIAALDSSGALLHHAETVLGNLTSAETTPELDALEEKFAPLLSEHASRIMHNKPLFARVKAVYDAAESAASDYTVEEKMLLEQTYEAFERAGATLSDADKERFEAISKELSILTVSFSQNRLKETNAFRLHLTSEEELAGLPATQREQAEVAAKEAGMEGWIVTLKGPSYAPFMTYADNRELRRRLYMAYNTICTHENDADNFDIVRQIVNKRQELAQLLGYATFADYALKRRMAQAPANVLRLLDRLIADYREPALQELEAVSTVARRSQGQDFSLEPWDFSYYSHKLQLERYEIDGEMLRPFLELSRVKQGVFGLATRLYGISFRREPTIPVYHPDVEAYEVLDADGSFLAVLYCDFHPRTGKQNGAWMTNYKEQWTEADGTDSRPHVAVVMNLSKPTATTPALLTLGEVSTFLHEFGHALHGMFARTKYRSLSGTNVYWDFVELPSQFMENYAVEKEFLRTFAVHYETGEPLPAAYIERIIASRNFNAAYACMRQVSFGLLDMAYYNRRTPLTEDIRTFEAEAWSRAQLLPPPPEACMSVQFSHIMAGGYAAGYYSYKWAEVLDADAFSLFKELGIFNREAASRFRDNILSRGGTEHPAELYRRFRGRDPQVRALLERDGLCTTATEK
ncbi:MAG: M3 family metallopeptidase [Alloprevotella sp.]|nr:M3 family metallopeptidase [Alloprevotella sp.]